MKDLFWMVVVFVVCAGFVEIGAGYRRFCAQERRHDAEVADD
jgi:hypothetical protein